MSSVKSMCDVAYELMSKKKGSTKFSKLWTAVSEATGASSESVVQFYTDLSLDSRFVSLGDSKWDIRARHKYEESHTEIELLDDDEYRDEENSDEYYDA